MALICMCCFCTEENGKQTYLRQTLQSLKNTINFEKHRLIVINNGLHVPELHQDWFELIEPGKNLGTAEGINLALKQREPGQFCIKCDDDWTTDVKGWVDLLEETMLEHPEIGILGLKRDDVKGEFKKQGNIWWSHDIFGTCTMYNPAMLDKCGYLNQLSQYGFDDSFISVRSEAAGFKNAFRVDIPIKNLDTEETGYTKWKRREAGVYLQEASVYMNMVKEGKLSYYYNPYES